MNKIAVTLAGFAGVVILVTIIAIQYKPQSPLEQNTLTRNGIQSLTPTATVSSDPGNSPPTVNEVKLYLIAIDDQGKSGEKIGCGDSAVSVTRTVETTTKPLTAAYQELLSLKDQYYGQSGLYNALYQSDLKLDSATVVDGIATVHLSGKMQLGGVCDNPRVEAQLKNTILQFPTVKKAVVFINGKLLEQVLSEK